MINVQFICNLCNKKSLFAAALLAMMGQTRWIVLTEKGCLVGHSGWNLLNRWVCFVGCAPCNDSNLNNICLYRCLL